MSRHLDRREFLRMAGAGAAAALLPAAARGFAAPPEDRPNILFVFSDDHSLQTIGAYRGGRGVRLNARRAESGAGPFARPLQG